MHSTFLERGEGEFLNLIRKGIYRQYRHIYPSSVKRKIITAWE